MKSIVIFDEFNEIDLKPSQLLHHYMELAREDVAKFLIDGQSLVATACPACGHKEVLSAFKKFGLQYNECAQCQSLYVSSRPTDPALKQFFCQSKARTFWNKELYHLTRKKRKEKIIKPRFQWIVDSTQEYLPQAKHIVDINANQYGYIEEMRNTRLFQQKSLLDPFAILGQEEFDPAIEIVRSPWWQTNWKETVDVISLFEVIDRVCDVDGLFQKAQQMLKKGGLCFITTILVSGFDLQTLWEKAENIFPPDRLNVFSVEGLQQLFQRHKFECLEFSTPGILDVEIVEKAYQENPEIKLPKFVEYLFNKRKSDVKKAFQEFLQANLLSSYGRILIRKK